MAEPSFRSELGVVRHNPLVLAVAGSPFLAALAISVASLVTTPPGAKLVPFLISMGVLLVSVAVLNRPIPKITPAPVSATRESITVGAKTYPRRAFRSGFVTRGDDGSTSVRLQPTNVLAPWLELRVASPAEADRLLAVLGLDALHSVARLYAASILRASGWRHVGVIVAMIVASFVGGAILHNGTPVIAAIAGMVLATFWPAIVDVGADGIVVSWLFYRRFVPAASIATISAYEESHGKDRVHGVELGLESGERYRIAVSSSLWDGGRAQMLASRIAAVSHARRAGIPLGSELSLLERGSSDARTWLERLRALGSGANATLRVAPVRSESLWRAVEDPNAEPHVRVAAAAALAGAVSGEERVRIADAAGATADPRVRVALEAAASGDDEALTRALDELAPDTDGAVRRSA